MKQTNTTMVGLGCLVILGTLVGCGSTTRKPDRVEVLHAQPVTEDYIVKRGDTINKIARAHNMTPEDVVALNNMRPPYTIYIGQKLKLQSGNADTIVVKQVFYN